MRFRNVYDISVLLGVESIDYPGDTPYSRELVESIKGGGAYDLSKLVMSAHSGTHIDFPSHFIPNGKSAHKYGVQELILPALVLSIKSKESIQTSELEKADIKPGDAILFKTNNSVSGQCKREKFSERFVYMTSEAADFCVEKKVGLVGIDYITIEKYSDDTFPAHRKILGNNILILEGINLKDVPAGKYTLFCFPLKIQNGEASPVRAILIK